MGNKQIKVNTRGLQGFPNIKGLQSKIEENIDTCLRRWTARCRTGSWAGRPSCKSNSASNKTQTHRRRQPLIQHNRYHCIVRNLVGSSHIKLIPSIQLYNCSCTSTLNWKYIMYFFPLVTNSEDKTKQV